MTGIRKIVLIGLLVSLINYSFAQEKCATDILPVNNRHSVEQFEQWIKEKKKTRQPFGIQQQFRTAAGVVRIPVVVHVIHQGEPIGIGSNISDEQIKSQIEVLNEDFRRQNTDASNTPSIFEPFAADVEVEFILARQNPEGLPTDGIVRVKGSKSAFDPDDDQFLISSHSFWPSEDYFNIWVTDLTGNYLGYAQFPVSDLPGLENSNKSRYTDGVAIDYMAFGSIEKYPEANLHSSYNLGRTTTHEVGHFLGLRHIWGDGDCNSDDYVNDTPVSSKSNSGYSSCNFPGPNTCGSGSDDLPDMFQNYMDYTNDQCMNLFTLDQKERIQTVLSHSPRRFSLTQSHALEEPELVPVDLEIRNIITPTVSVCNNEANPEITIRNYGEAVINSATINLYINGALRETKTVSDLSLATYESEVVYFGNQSIPAGEEVEFSYEITAVNDGTDDVRGNAVANTLPVTTVQSLPLIEDFETFSSDDYRIINSDGDYTWNVMSATAKNPENKALGIRFYDYENLGAQDLLITQSYSLPQGSPTILMFDVAYTRYRNESLEGLKVLLSDDCGNTFDHIVYEKYGEDLQTAPPQTTPFTPLGEHHWRREAIDLSEFAGKNVQLSFIAINEYGNNLYIDNILMTAENIADVAVREITSPTPALCDGEFSPSISIANEGSTKIGSLEAVIDINGETSTITHIFSDSLNVSSTAEIEFPAVDVPEGENTISIEIVAVNGMFDFKPSNNIITRTFLIDDTREILPLRETFNDFDQSNWHIINPDNELTWELTVDNRNKIVTFPSSRYFNQQDEDWLLSPVLDFSDVNEATLFFDLSYSGETPDRLQILYTDNCGETYQTLGYDKQGNELTTYMENKIFDKERVSLEQLIGINEVRLAFVATSGHGSNIEIDNIEIFLEDVPAPVISDQAIALYPNPSEGIVNFTFNLNDKEDIQLFFMDYSGKVLASYSLPNTLNQTHQLDFTNQAEGIYLIKVVGQTFQTTKRLVIY